MNVTCPTQASRTPPGLRFTATGCHDGEANSFIISFESGKIMAIVPVLVHPGVAGICHATLRDKEPFGEGSAPPSNLPHPVPVMARKCATQFGHPRCVQRTLGRPLQSPVVQTHGLPAGPVFLAVVTHRALCKSPGVVGHAAFGDEAFVFHGRQGGVDDALSQRFNDAPAPKAADVGIAWFSAQGGSAAHGRTVVFGTLMLNVMLLILANRNLTRPAFLSAMAPTPWLGLVRVVGWRLIRAEPTTYGIQNQPHAVFDR